MRILVQNWPEGKRISFWCPGCDEMMTVCPVRWNWNGDVDKPTLSPSILQRTGPYGDLAPPEKVGKTDICHCFVRDGNIEFCGDCTHNKRGTMPLPELETILDIHHEPDDGWVWYVRKDKAITVGITACRVEVPATVESLSAMVRELQNKWDDTERRLAAANAKIEQLQEKAARLQKFVGIMDAVMNRIADL